MITKFLAKSCEREENAWVPGLRVPGEDLALSWILLNIKIHLLVFFPSKLSRGANAFAIFPPATGYARLRGAIKKLDFFAFTSNYGAK